MDRVVTATVERLAGVVGEVERIDRILGQVGPEPYLRDDGPFQIVIAIDTHGVGVHRPTVGDTSQCGNFPLHQLLRCLWRALQSRLYGRIGLVESETLADLEAD